MYIFSNILGVFIFDEKFQLLDKVLFNNLEDYKNKHKFIEQLKNKYKNLKELDNKSLQNFLEFFKNKDFLNDFYNKNLELTKLSLKNSANEDILIIRAINSIEELDKSLNSLVKALREWYELYNPEYSKAIQFHENFVQDIVNYDKRELLAKLNFNEEQSIGAELAQRDKQIIIVFATQIHKLYQLRKDLVDYVSQLMEDYCPNLKILCETILGAKLIEHAGSLKRLSEMPSSTIQVLGAEKALFRHMKTGAKPPRHGLIVAHPLIAKSPERMHGKIARALADKISIASKVDYFKGQFIGDKLKKILINRFKTD
ncbi:hypothetical protein HYW99_00700 [Candidatus Woesearchaeota archaeon]|nr:hypothetical protein [Candidatus Woesearchaeota archaeon]